MSQQLQDFVSGTPVALSPAAIERELASLWDKRASDSGAEDEGVGRITIGNFVWLGTSQRVPRIRSVFAKLVSRYPCRLFLLEFVPGEPELPMTAYINAHCFLAKGVRREVCCEEIHIRFGRKALSLVPAAILPLLVPDVPTGLWYFSSDPGQYEPILPGLIAMADRSITELAFLPDPAEGMKAMAEERLPATSLAWFRYAPIRDQIASLFDDESCGALLDKVTSLSLGWAGDANDRQSVTNAALLAGWIASCLRWTPDDALAADGSFQYRAPHGTLVRVETGRHAPHSPAEKTQITRVAFGFAGGERIEMAAPDHAGQMETVMVGSCWHSSAPRVVDVAALDEAEALGYALNSRSDRRFFLDAARLGWPLLGHLLARAGGPPQ